MPAEDYTKYRAQGVIPYAVEDLIGRNDSNDKAQTTGMTVSGTADLLPPNPLGRRNYIKVKNEGAVDVAITTATGVAHADGIIVDANGGEWEDSTDAILYIVSTGADSNVRVYERSSKIWDDKI